VRYERLQYLDQLQQYVALANAETDPSIAQYYQSFSQQIQAVLDDPQQVGNEALTFLINSAVVRHEAASLQVAVTDKDLQTTIEQFFGYIPAATLTAQPSPTQRPSATPAVDQATLVATPTLSATQAALLLPSLVPSTPTPYTEQSFLDSYTKFLDTLRQKTGMTETDFRERIRAELLKNKARSAIIAGVSRNQEQYHLFRIVVGDEITAVAVRERLSAGEAWPALVSEVSTDTTSNNKGGDIGWIGSGILPSVVEEKVFALNVGEISQPQQTASSSWAIFKLQEKAVRPLEDIPYAAAQEAAYNKWLSDLKTKEGAVNIIGFAADLIPTDPKL
jgi:parvulin-like peptidyl-prolyl isomerase